VTLNLIPSFGAWTRSWRVPRYRSVVCTEACPSSNWICSNSPPAALHIFAQVLLLCRIRHSRRYAECRIMPNRCRGWSFGVERVANAINQIRHSPSESKALQKGQQVIVGLVAARLGVDRGGFGKDVFLDGEIRVEINLRCFDRLVPQPKCY